MITATRRTTLENIIEILPSAPAEQNPINIYTSGLKTYSYVLEDVRRTLLTITIIAVLNIALYFILKLKVISLFGLIF